MNSGYKTFAENFGECCGQSCDRLAYEKQETSGEYTKLVRRCSELYDSIAEKLGDSRQLINQFDAAKVSVLSTDEKYVYQQGFQDCVYLLRWLGMLGARCFCESNKARFARYPQASGGVGTEDGGRHKPVPPLPTPPEAGENCGAQFIAFIIRLGLPYAA